VTIQAVVWPAFVAAMKTRAAVIELAQMPIFFGIVFALVQISGPYLAVADH